VSPAGFRKHPAIARDKRGGIATGFKPGTINAKFQTGYDKLMERCNKIET
jgi:hypothetical protein